MNCQRDAAAGPWSRPGPARRVRCRAVSTLEAIVLGLVQGLTEFLPVSSSGHLRVVPALLGWADLWRIAGAWIGSLTDRSRRSDPDARMGWYLIAATVPIGLFGLAFKDQIESGARDLRLIAGSLIVMGLVLLLAEQVGTRRKELADLTTRDGVAVGLAQSMALVPGVSRSGATISAGLFLGYKREAAARFSFLLSVPAVVLSGLFQLKDIGAGDGPGLVPTVVATLVSFVVGYAAIAWLLRYLTTHSTLVFVIYRVALGLLLVGLLAGGQLEPR